VVVGAGFGGLFATRRLRSAPVEVTLIDRTTHHLFQPAQRVLAGRALEAAARETAARETADN